MKCKNCSAELKEDSRFCGKCGAPAASDAETDADENIKQKPDLIRKSKNSKLVLMGLSALLLLGGISGGSMIVNANRVSEYQETISLASRYYNQLDYERAEELYLHSIDIQPKEKEPYIQLVQIYTVTEQPEKAQAIVAKAQEKLPVQEAEEVKQKADEAAKEVEMHKAEEAARLEEEQRLALQQPAYRAYAEILQRMLDGYDPLGSGYELYLDSSLSKPLMQYSLADMDDDGIDELFIKYDGTGTGFSQGAFMTYGLIYTYDPDLSETALIHRGTDLYFFPMTNGYLKTRWIASTTQVLISKTLESLHILKFDPEIKSFQGIVSFSEIDRDVMEEHYEANKRYAQGDEGDLLVFPAEFDNDNDGFLYVVHNDDPDDKPFVDKDEIENVIASHTDNAEYLDLVYEDITQEAISKLKG